MKGYTAMQMQAFLLSLVAGLATGIGGVIAIALRKIGHAVNDFLLGFSAGVMASVATFGLLHKAMDSGGLPITIVGIVAGCLMLYALDRYLPHLHETFQMDMANVLAYRRGWLIAIAITLHNVPEGLAVATGYASAPSLGLLLAVAIALHNIPEGIAVAVPFRLAGLSRWRCFWYATASGLAEPLAALAGVLLLGVVTEFIPLALAFAGGAMLYVVSDELIPESHSHGYEHQATFGFTMGFILVLILMRVIGEQL